MPEFKTHLIAGVITTLLTLYLISTTHFLNISSFSNSTTIIYLEALLIGIFAAILPDIDADNSTPNDLIIGSLLISVVLSLLYYYFFNKNLIFFIYPIIIVCLVIYSKLFIKHRGWIHSIKTALLISIVFAIFQQYFLAITFLIGYLTHLTLDRHLVF